jgi:hypothetical protein
VIYWLKLPNAEHIEILGRLKHICPIASISESKASDVIQAGDICLSTGGDFSGRRGDLGEKILRAGVHILLVPPFKLIQKYVFSDETVEVSLKKASFSSGIILDAELKRASGLDEFRILFNQTLNTFPGTPAVVTAQRAAVVVRYQPRSTWGYLVFSTLLLHSASVRSSRLHREIFLNSMENWLGKVVREKSTDTTEPETHPDFEAIPEYPLIILALARLATNHKLEENEFQASYDFIRDRFGGDVNLKSWNSHWILEMEQSGLISTASDSSCQVNNDFIELELDRLRLTSYVRRLT